MRPKAVTMYLPSVNAVADDFVDRLDKIRDVNTGEVKNFNNEILKWTLECRSLAFFKKFCNVGLSGLISYNKFDKEKKVIKRLMCVIKTFLVNHICGKFNYQ